MTDARALLPCPFCGGEAERYDDHDTGSINEGGSCITCKRCGASSPMHFERKENLISSWNDRVPSPPVNVGSNPLAEYKKQDAKALIWTENGLGKPNQRSNQGSLSKGSGGDRSFANFAPSRPRSAPNEVEPCIHRA